MAQLTEDEASAQVNADGAELDKRARRYKRLDRYFRGESVVPQSIRTAKVTSAYRMLMEFAETNYARLIIKAATGRLQVGGIRSSDEDADQAVWQAWQDNHMNAESRLGHDSILTHGRAFALIWPEDPDAESPRITLESADTMIVRYRDGSRYDRVSALRRWTDKRVPYATLYTPDFVYKFQGPEDSPASSTTKWTRREVDGEEWPLPNPSGVVPAVEISTNRQLRYGRYGHTVGDFEGVLGLLDRINVLEFLRLVIAFTAGFPIRGVVGDKILKDDDGNPVAPFELAVDVIAQFENPNVKIVELAAADIKTFGDAIDHDVETLAGITQTPAYYLRSVPIQNVSADAIRAADTPLDSRVDDHKPFIAEGWEEVERVVGLMLASRVILPADAQLSWVNRQSHSLAERADAALKLNGVMPWQFIAENIFELSQDDITRFEAMRASDQLTALLAAPPAAPAPPAPVLPPGT